MIKFFRHIRQNLLMENLPTGQAGKTSKYIKYAIGEIILVVIGILIALQINNWNEQNAIHKTQEKHLRAIKNEMINNLNSLKIEQQRLANIIENGKKLISLIDETEEREKMPREQVSQLLFNTGGNPTFRVPFADGALSELINSGGLKDIENDSIRNILASWEGKLTSLRQQEKSIEELSNGWRELMITDSNIRTMLDDVNYSKNILEIKKSKKDYNIKEIFDSNEFENRLILYTSFSTRLSITIYPDFEDHLKHLISLIDLELHND